MPEPVRLAEAARILGVSVQHVTRLARRGELSFTSTPLGRLYDRADLERRRAHPPRSGRPPKPRPASDRPPPSGEVVLLRESVTVSYAEGPVLLEGGRPYRVARETAAELVRRGYAQRMGA